MKAQMAYPLVVRDSGRKVLENARAVRVEEGRPITPPAIDQYKIISHFDFTRCSNPEASQEKSGVGSLGSLTGEWLDSPAAARFLRISVGSLRNMTSNGQIPYSKLGRRNRYRMEDLRQLLTKEKRGCYGN